MPNSPKHQRDYRAAARAAIDLAAVKYPTLVARVRDAQREVIRAEDRRKLEQVRTTESEVRVLVAREVRRLAQEALKAAIKNDAPSEEGAP